jgi:thiamine-monophosphate kinase
MARVIESEEDLIQQFLAPLTAQAPGAFGLRDDCAVVQTPPGHDLVVTTDALVSGLHFLADETPENVAWRALAVNVSDLAAKGATPMCYLMALSLPDAPNADWMMRFASGLRDAQEHYGLSLIGGDTDKRAGVALSITITAMGSVAQGRMVQRATAMAGDRIFVSGTLGDASLGLALRRTPDSKRFAALDRDQKQFLLDRFLRPAARIELSPLLLTHASAAMDISDGLAKDLGRLCKASGVAARVSLAGLPRSVPAEQVFADHADLSDAVVSGGDDYEILATVPPGRAADFEEAAMELGAAVTDIGEIEEGRGLTLLDGNGLPVTLAKLGYDHF